MHGVESKKKRGEAWHDIAERDCAHGDDDDEGDGNLAETQKEPGSSRILRRNSRLALP